MTNTPTEVVSSFIASIERRDAAAAVAHLSSQCEYDNVPIGKVHGKVAVLNILEPLLDSCSTVEWPVLRSAAEGNLVFNERVDRFEMAHGWVELEVAGMFEVTDGGDQPLARLLRPCHLPEPTPRILKPVPGHRLQQRKNDE